MSDAFVERYAGQIVPRYTSYPTAAEFSPAVGPAEHGRWLSRLDPQESVSLYLHIPYCRALCHYCGCHAKMAIRDEVIAAYRATLEQEIHRVGSFLPEKLPVARLHWGGGTPSILEANGMALVLAAVTEHFTLDAGFEHAIELDPRAVTPELASRLAALGINRASLGVQDLDPVVQLAIGRVQPFAVVAAATRALREAGIASVNFDLLYGLPHQSVASVTETARQVVALGPDRIAAYGYAHMPSRRRNQRLIDETALPDSGARFAQARAAAAVFLDAGYSAIGIDHFSRPDDALAQAANHGRLHRNFQGYTDDDRGTLIGFGASAISRLGEGFVQNTADNNSYRRAIAEGRLATARGHRLTDMDRLRSGIIERLMCDARVDLGAFGGAGDFADELALLRPLAADRLVTIDNGIVAMTPEGEPFVRLVAAIFDTYRQTEPGRFSAAI